MRINADFSQRAISAPSADQWITSPASGVDRRMLDRIGDEVARATSVVRYAPRSSFSRHMHDEGEEFLVLEGIFSDEHADYPCGTYVRNPPGSGHSPFSDFGCRILVKLRQFDMKDCEPVVIDTTNESGWQAGSSSGVEIKRLHQFVGEEVSMLRFGKGENITIDVGDGGLEWLLVNGGLTFEQEDYPKESWFRFAAGDKLIVRATENCLVWQKTGHLPPH